MSAALVYLVETDGTVIAVFKLFVSYLLSFLPLCQMAFGTFLIGQLDVAMKDVNICS